MRIPPRPRLNGTLLTVLVGLLSPAAQLSAQPAAQSEPEWQVFQVEELVERRGATERPWLQFLRVPDLFAGIYELAAGETDPQTPHTADEVYQILAGRATIVVGDERTKVRAGTIVYVPKEVEHRFVDVVEDLTVIVFFATPRGG